MSGYSSITTTVLLYSMYRSTTTTTMAKTDSFFIRKALPLISADGASGAGDFLEVGIDLGAYVDALGKAVLRIHNIAVQYSDAAGTTPQVKAGKPASADFQLTTQTQTAIVLHGCKQGTNCGRVRSLTSSRTRVMHLIQRAELSTRNM